MPKTADVDENSKGRVQLPQNTIDEMRELAQWQHRTGAQFALVAVKKEISRVRSLKLRWEIDQRKKLGLKR
jgi:hypothetical protein